MNLQEISTLIKSAAIEAGFDACGISKAEKLDSEESHVTDWLENKFHGNMEYMKNNLSKRLDPRLLQDNTTTVITLLLNYYPEQKQNKHSYQIAKYAYGQDYHDVVKQKLNQFEQLIQSQFPEANMRSFVDSAPILEKSFAVKSGLGWIGKNSLLINKTFGSFMLIAETLINIEMEYNQSTEQNHCGNCTLCMDACPTEAIIKPFTIDARRCISYLTKRNEDVPDDLVTKLNDRIWGCDICQDVCPWNMNLTPHAVPEFEPHSKLISMNKEDWNELNEEEYKMIFRQSYLINKFHRLKRNIGYNSTKQNV